MKTPNSFWLAQKLGLTVTTTSRYGKTLVKHLLSKGGIELHRKDTVPKFASALKRLANRNIPLNTVIDIGASNGSWSRALMQYYPNTNYLLIEAQPIHEPDLRKFCGQHPNARYVLAAAGAENGELFFDANNPFGGLASYKPLKGKCIRVPVTTVDTLLKQYNLAPPYLLKLDTHGFEVPIFNGAADCLSKASVLVVECYNFKIAPEAILFYEMCAYLERYGFRCMDMYDLLVRPCDKAFWQMDILFMKADRDEFASAEYH